MGHFLNGDVCDFFCLHLGVCVIVGVFVGTDKNAVFTGVGFFVFAVEKVGYVCVFFCFADVDLFFMVL